MLVYARDCSCSHAGYTCSFATATPTGRKLRYDVHAKLVGFMPPNTTREVVSAEARRDLYDSLFSRNTSKTT